MNVLVTGSDGFIGKNLRVALSRRKDCRVLCCDVGHDAGNLERHAREADFVFHLAGVNRPSDPSEFVTGNVELTRRLLAALEQPRRRVPVVFSSSRQAEQDNPYGRSKRDAEKFLFDYASRTGSPVRVFRFPNVFGKWSRPDYNSVVSTFCHHLAHGLPVSISDRAHEVTFVYIDEVVRCLLDCLRDDLEGATHADVAEVFTLSLGQLHDMIAGFRSAHDRNEVADLSHPLTRYLHATFLTYWDPAMRCKPVDLKVDARGWLFELVKSPHAGQIFVSRTNPGIVRGNHYHDTKVEKFCVVQGRGRIRMRQLLTDEIVDYECSDDPIRVVDIPAGWTHSIENSGSDDLITLFWASEIFDPARPDTYPEPVVK